MNPQTLTDCWGSMFGFSSEDFQQMFKNVHQKPDCNQKRHRLLNLMGVSGNEQCGHWQNEQIQLYLFLCIKCKTRGGSLEMGWWTSYFNCSILYNYQHPIPFVDRYLILLGIQIHFFHDMKFHIRNNGGKLLLYKKKQSICI